MLDLIYTDTNLVDVGVLKAYELDYEIGGDNHFEIITDINSPLVSGGMFYFENEEYGGLIDSIKIDVKSGKKTSSGRTWRGLLSSYIIEPDTNQDYKEMSDSMTSIISSLISDALLTGLITVGTSELEDTYSVKFDRYTSVYDGIAKLLRENNGKLSFKWDAENKKVVLNVKTAIEYDRTSDLIAFTVQKSARKPNAIVGLGKGELAERTVIHRYVNSSGEIVDTNPYVTGTDVWTIVFDYPNAESEEELVKSSVEALLKARSELDFIKIFVNDISLDIGDSVSAQDVNSGLSVTAKVSNKIVQIKNGKTSISYEVE